MSALVPAALLCLVLAFLVGSILNALFPPRPGRFRDLMLRARLVRTARPEGPPPSTAPGAARCRRGEVPIADTDAMHAVRDELLRGRPTAGWALAPVLYGDRGANPYPAETLTDMPAVEDGPRVCPAYREWERKQAARRWLP